MMKSTTMKMRTTMSIHRNWRVSQVISKRNGAFIDVLEDGPYILYRSCAGGLCRYSDDLWQAEIYIEHLLAQMVPIPTE
jgi:hypothetical protein